ncbi:hypothetical protein QBC37DRAFT_449207 [Rhypophila decipiens]|uniref:Uncharacterized protein n=1 Tax=Rhypophila decipiens TaxID=261697 RepID=A0AAN7B3V3_9PEZI|nr:hypothetical protein QBC37DRAFT_449207 [Rhypophila decipiens]
MRPPCNFNVYITIEAATIIGLTFFAATSIIVKSIMAKRKKSSNAAKSVTPLPHPPAIKAALDSKKVADASGPLQGESSTSTLPPVIEEIDHRPDNSPYASTPCTVPFASPMTVPKDILIKSPKLHAAFEDKLPELPDIPEDIGHVLVHYLHTGTYESLKPKEPFIPSKQIVELKTSIKAYAAARAYDLPELMRLTQQQIEKHGEGLPLPSLLEITRDSFPTLSEHDDWFIYYLKSRIRPHLEDPKSILGSDLLDRISGILSPHKVLLRTVLEMFCERIVPLPKAIANMAHAESARPNSPPPPSASSVALVQTRSKAMTKEDSLPLKKQATPWPSPDPELASVTSGSKDGISEPAAESVPEHKAVELNTEREVAPPASVVAVAPTTAFRIEAEPVLNHDDVFKPTVMPTNRERKDSGKLLDMAPEWGLGPVIKDIEPVPEPETPERERPGKRILREVDSGFWEFSPSEPEPLPERPSSVVEIFPELEPLKEVVTPPEPKKEEEPEIAAPDAPEPKKDDEFVDKRDFATPHDNDTQDQDKIVETDEEQTKATEHVQVPAPAPIAASASTTDAVNKAEELVDSTLDKVADKAELVGSEIMSDTAKVEPNHGDPQSGTKLTAHQPETSDAQPNSDAEVQPEPQAETKAEPQLLSDTPQSADSADAKKAEPAVEPKQEPAREPEVPAAESHAALDTGVDTDANPAVPVPEPAPQQEGTKTVTEPNLIQDLGSAARSKSWKRKLSLRYPVLFGRGM